MNKGKILSWSGNSVVGKILDFGFVLISTFRTFLCHFLSVCPWTTYFTSLVFTFLISKIEVVRGYIFGTFVEI